MSYIGSTPTTQSFIAGTDYFNGTGAQVSFTLSRSVNSVNDIEVIVNNVEQIPSGYSVSGTTLTFSAAPSSGTSNVYVRYLSTTNLSLAIPAGTSASFNTVTATNLTTTNGASIQGLTVGRGAGAVATNTAVGASALAANTSGDTNTATGYQALTTNTSGTSNTAYGVQALRFNTTGGSNASFGRGSLNSNTTGGSNVAIGENALTSNTTASNNTAVGYQALYSHVNSDANSQNTAIGYRAGYLATGYSNAFIGGSAGANTTTGIKQTFVGYGAGADITTGSKNTILGTYGGNQGGLDIRTASNYIVLSDGDGNPRTVVDGSGNFKSTGTGSATLYPEYKCRAWVNFNGNGTVAIRASGNVSSITDNNTGDYTVNFTTAMPDANYAVIPGPADWTTLGVSSASDATTSSVRLLSRRPDNSAAQDREIVAVSIFR